MQNHEKEGSPGHSLGNPLITKNGKGERMTSDYIEEKAFETLLQALMPENRLALELMQKTGMRVDDALSLTYEALADTARIPGCHSLIYREKKTKKLRTVSIDPDFRDKLLKRPRPESPWLFPGRNPEKHRTRQAVFKDLQRAAKLFRLNGKRIKAHVSPHTARKIYAVNLYHEKEKGGLLRPLEAVKADLNHENLAVTMLYALADQLSQRNYPKI